MGDLLPLATLYFCVSFALAIAGTMAIERRSSQIGLVQAPNDRSAHSKPTPTGGGAAIASVGIIGFLLTAFELDPRYAVAGGLAAAFAALGFIDDRFDLPAAVRLPLHIAIVSALIALVMPLRPLFIGPLELSAVPLALVLVLAGTWWINLFNFMDGIDGIAGSQAVLVLAGSALIASINGHPTVWAAIILIAASSGFLIRNWPPARIFMGDVGSNFLAFSILAIALLGHGDGDINYFVWLILMSVFVSDASITLSRRTINGEKPWHAHNRHAYQRLARQFGHLRVTLLYGLLTALWSIPMAILANFYPSSATLIIVVTYAPIAALMFLCGAGTESD